MSIQAVDDALHYFLKIQSLLGVTSSVDIDECVLLASNDGRLRFAGAILDAIVGEPAITPEIVVLGGLRAIVDPAATILSYSLFAEDVSSELRTSVLAKMRSVFTEIFPCRCEPILAHRATSAISAWNSLCFMWWEILPRHGVPDLPFLHEADSAILELMGGVLEVEHLACKEAALHGLGLWQPACPEVVRSVIEAHSNAIPDVLREYAESAKTGNLT